ncbi:MAG: methyl-accepting chemotaxis protein, partial [Thermodesulfobacteriota bacterium]|nr:methyl-accepting chemotaxis protein [Thermodesulfobacteriota bacterium]
EKMEIISSNMLSLGEKAQQIGIVLDVINELSQQVTVLSYNATIEAAGAGEMGKRFMAVADRIIKLAERSVESSKEIKAIIDDVQNDSHKTIMSTEDGMKAVERGIVYSSEVKQSLESIDEFTKHVLSSVDEINISLNQQKTGVEQAAAEVEDITMLVCETEDSSKQVMKTAEQLFDMAELLEKI